MKLLSGVLLAGLLLGIYGWISYSKLTPEVRHKRRLLDHALRKQGYTPHYFLLSGYRPPWLNRLLPLASRNSVHQRGQAIDVWVVDIDGNYLTIQSDLAIIANTLDGLDRTYPAYRGGVGLYRASFSPMVHFDVSGRHRHWNY